MVRQSGNRLDDPAHHIFRAARTIQLDISTDVIEILERRLRPNQFIHSE
jgi:hypothetical protein